MLFSLFKPTGWQDWPVAGSTYVEQTNFELNVLPNYLGLHFYQQLIFPLLV